VADAVDVCELAGGDHGVTAVLDVSTGAA